jgi:hypothetical protein
VGLAGCASNANESEPDPTQTTQDTATTTEEATTTEAEQTTEDEPDVDRPANYRWDMQPGRNEELRSELGQYVDGAVGPVVEDHPAFEYSTDSERDDHTVDFEALKLFRDAEYDIRKENNTRAIPYEHYVEAFVNDDLEQEAKTNGFKKHDTAAPSNYDVESWLNAETVEDSLDLSHGLIEAMVSQQSVQPAEQGAILREAYKRHHKFDVLAWETNMGASNGSHNARITGLMYSPDDDKIRAHDVSPPQEVGTGGTGVEASGKWHSEIQEWDIFNEGGELFHPLLFHTDEWNRQNPGFKTAKGEATLAITSIATDLFAGDLLAAVDGPETDQEGYFAPTTGLAKQLTRTLLEYNENDANFEDVWRVSSVTEKLRLNGGKYVLDAGEDTKQYSGTFDGSFAVYEVEEEKVVDKVWADRAGQYDNFSQSYDELA